jgi:hypothetical protein
MTVPLLDDMARRVADFPLALWALFFLVQTGRGAGLDQVSPEEGERVLNYLYDLPLTAPFGIKTTEAPHDRAGQVLAEQRGCDDRHRRQMIRPKFAVQSFPHRAQHERDASNQQHSKEKQARRGHTCLTQVTKGEMYDDTDKGDKRHEGVGQRNARCVPGRRAAVWRTFE